LDFTNPDTQQWWKANVKSALLDYGISATWNDKNEFEVWTPDALAHGFGAPYPVQQAKVLQTMLMMRTSQQAQLEAAPR
ncbi:TIM-barrel domain-containing protein, partial [Escherichia coli]|uniref:TIM-barrel domain-containing protein n=1 Tax=Escherichia coli TaxID=562 RepID=UPI0039E0C30D